MTNIQQELDKINEDWGKYPNPHISKVQNRQKVYVFKLVEIESFPSISEAIVKYGNTIENCIREHVPLGDLYFSLDKNARPTRRKNNHGKEIKVFLKGEFIGQYKKVTDCAAELGIDRTCIQHTLKGKYKSYRGYTFEYV